MAPPVGLTTELIEPRPPLIGELAQSFDRLFRRRTQNGMQRDLLERVLAYTAQMEQQLAEQRQRIAELEAISTTDELTGLPNRRAFHDFLARTMARARRHGETGVIGFFDLDRFKHINDRYGHAAGDAALRHVADGLQARIRSSDYAARLHGDEFAVVLVRAEPEQGTERIRRIEDEVSAAPFRHGSRRISVSLSCGVVTYGPDSEADALLSLADMRMYERKRAGRTLAAE